MDATTASLAGVVRFVGPPEGFYETGLTVSAALYIALAVELRFIRPRKIVLPDDPKRRRRFVIDAISLMVFPVLSLAGFVAGYVALYQGGTKVLGSLTAIGFAATLVSFALMSLRVFFSVLGQAIPWSAERKRQVMIALGVALIGVAVFLLVAYPS